jgi:hypothetical protein
MMATRFKHCPQEPKSTSCENAYAILCNAHDAATSFLDIFERVRTARVAKGMPTDEEQDLLRAMLVFASAGLDSMAKQLVRDALPSVIECDDGAAEMFKDHIERRLGLEDRLGRKFLANVLGDANPRQRLMDQLLADLTADSLQSTEQLLKVASYFNIPSRQIAQNPNTLKDVFKVRNEIGHEMDIDFSQSNRSRRPRAKQKMVGYTDELFRAAAAFLSEVDLKLNAKSDKKLNG